MKSKLFLITCLGFINMLTAQNTNDNQQPKKVYFTIGAGVGTAPRYEGSKNYLVAPAPIVSVDWIKGQYIRLGAGLEANIVPSRKWSFGPKLNFSLPRGDQFVNNDQVASLEELDLSIAAGLFTQYKFAKAFDVRGEYTHDISGVSDGGVATFEFGYTLKYQRLSTRLSANTAYATANYLDTYFGINANNIGTSALPYYDLSGGLKNIGTAVNVTYALNRKWILTGQLAYNNLLGDVADSPIIEVGSQHQFSGGLALLYRL